MAVINGMDKRAALAIRSAGYGAVTLWLRLAGDQSRRRSYGMQYVPFSDLFSAPRSLHASAARHAYLFAAGPLLVVEQSKRQLTIAMKPMARGVPLMKAGISGYGLGDACAIVPLTQNALNDLTIRGAAS